MSCRRVENWLRLTGSENRRAGDDACSDHIRAYDHMSGPRMIPRRRKIEKTFLNREFCCPRKTNNEEVFAKRSTTWPKRPAMETPKPIEIAKDKWHETECVAGSIGDPKHITKSRFTVDDTKHRKMTWTPSKLKVPGAKKLWPRWIGPYEIIQRVGPVAYKLRLPNNLKIHDVFHVSLLARVQGGWKVQATSCAIDRWSRGVRD